MLEDFKPTLDVFRNFNARQIVYKAVASDIDFLSIYEKLVKEVVIPYLKSLLLNVNNNDNDNTNVKEMCKRDVADGIDKKYTFYYQYPPSLRLQPGPSPEYGRIHRDAEYGHQDGEINFWMPLSYYHMTQTTLDIESIPNLNDFHPIEIDYGEIGHFHGTLCHHRAPPNLSSYTRVSLDFRIGISGYFDPEWSLEGIRAQHGRRHFIY
jgi:hypothetical protein